MTEIERATKILVPGRDAWTKQPWESWKAFEAFCAYRDQGVTRTLKTVAERIVETNPKRKVEMVEHQLGEWSRLYRWTDRLDEYAVHLDRIRLETREELQRRVEREDVEIADQMIRLVRRTTDAVDEVEGGIPLELADRWIEKAVRIRRLAAGLSTENMKAGLVITSQDLQKVLNRIVDIACDGYVPAEKQEEFIRRVIEEAS